MILARGLAICAIVSSACCSSGSDATQKEMSKRIDGVERRTAELNQEIETLRAELKALETRLEQPEKASEAPETPPPAKAHVTIESNPPGAEVMIGGKTVGKTPMELEATTGEELRIGIRKKGYAPGIRVVQPQGDTVLSFQLEKQ